MSIELIVALCGLALLFAVMIGTTVKTIHDQMRDDAQEDYDHD